MSIEFETGATVQVEPPDIPEIRAEVPSSTVAVIPLEGPRGPQGLPGPSGSGSDIGQVKTTLTASATLSGHRAVTIRPDGTLEYASNTVLNHLHAPIWLTTAAVTSGDQAIVLLYGVLTEPSWSWTPAAPLYLGINGVVTQVPPSVPALFLAQLGIATSPTTVFIDRQPSILLV
jgi:hypothetical protein